MSDSVTSAWGEPSPPGFSVHGILQARKLEWVAISSSRGSSWPRDWTHVSCIGRQILYCWVTREAQLCSYTFIYRKKHYIYICNKIKYAFIFSSVAQSCLTLCQTLQHARLPWWLSSKESTYQCRRHGFNPWVGKIPERRKWQLTPVFLPGKSHGQRSLVGQSPWGHKRVGYDLETKQPKKTNWTFYVFTQRQFNVF